MSETENVNPYRRLADCLNSDGASMPKPNSVDREMADCISRDNDLLLKQPAPIDAPTASEYSAERDVEPGAGGFSVERMNHEYALVTWGSKAVVIKEQAGDPIKDRVQILTLEAFRA